MLMHTRGQHASNAHHGSARIAKQISDTRLHPLCPFPLSRARGWCCCCAMQEGGYGGIICQHGRGAYVPSGEAAPAGFAVSSYRFKAGLEEDMRAARLVISHAGSGSIFEALALCKPLIVVVNEALMDNHQAELADALEAEGYLLSTTPEGLPAAVERLRGVELRPYPGGEAEAVAEALAGALGVAESRAS